jgi:hypothetical protein
MKRLLIAEIIGAVVGGVLSRILFPHEPGHTFILYGGAGGLIGGMAGIGVMVAIIYISGRP